MLILFALPLALSPVRPAGRPFVLKAVDDLDFIESPLVVDTLLLPPVGGLAVTTFLGLFCPVLLAAEAEGAVEGLPSLLKEIEGSEGNLDIMGGLGGRADVNFWLGSVVLADDKGALFLLRAVGEDFGDSFFSSRGDS